MKKFSIIIAFCLATVNCCAQDTSIISRFKLWLLNNEARMLSNLSFDHEIMARIETPFSIIPEMHDNRSNPVRKILETHRKFYIFLDEIDQIYSLGTRFGNGRLAIVIKQARPEVWSILPLEQSLPVLRRATATAYRKMFYDTLVKTLNLDENRDKDLSARLNQARRQLSDEEFRLFSGYLETFSALYTSDRSGKMIKAFIEFAARKRFAEGIVRLLEPDIVSVSMVQVQAPVQGDAELEDPLAELEKLAALTDAENKSNPVPPELEQEMAEENETESIENSSNDLAPVEEPAEQQDPQTTEEPEVPAGDLFNIWD